MYECTNTVHTYIDVNACKGHEANKNQSKNAFKATQKLNRRP